MVYIDIGLRIRPYDSKGMGARFRFLADDDHRH